jgi:predicted transcriptional regulator
MEADRITIKTLSIHSRIPYMTLHDIISDSNNNRGTLRTWLKIEDYYQSKNKNKKKK